MSIPDRPFLVLEPEIWVLWDIGEALPPRTVENRFWGYNGIFTFCYTHKFGAYVNPFVTPFLLLRRLPRSRGRCSPQKYNAPTIRVFVQHDLRLPLSRKSQLDSLHHVRRFAHNTGTETIRS